MDIRFAFMEEGITNVILFQISHPSP